MQSKLKDLLNDINYAWKYLLRIGRTNTTAMKNIFENADVWTLI